MFRYGACRKRGLISRPLTIRADATLVAGAAIATSARRANPLVTSPAPARRPNDHEAQPETGDSNFVRAANQHAASKWYQNGLGDSSESDSEDDGEILVDNTGFLPRYMRGMAWKEDQSSTYSRTVRYTETDEPLPQPSAHEFQNSAAMKTISDNPDLFHVPDRLDTHTLAGHWQQTQFRGRAGRAIGC